MENENLEEKQNQEIKETGSLDLEEGKKGHRIF